MIQQCFIFTLLNVPDIYIIKYRMKLNQKKQGSGNISRRITIHRQSQHTKYRDSPISYRKPDYGTSHTDARRHSIASARYHPREAPLANNHNIVYGHRVQNISNKNTILLKSPYQQPTQSISYQTSKELQNNKYNAQSINNYNKKYSSQNNSKNLVQKHQITHKIEQMIEQQNQKRMRQEEEQQDSQEYYDLLQGQKKGEQSLQDEQIKNKYNKIILNRQLLNKNNLFKHQISGEDEQSRMAHNDNINLLLQNSSESQSIYNQKTQKRGVKHQQNLNSNDQHSNIRDFLTNNSIKIKNTPYNMSSNRNKQQQNQQKNILINDDQLEEQNIIDTNTDMKHSIEYIHQESLTNHVQAQLYTHKKYYQYLAMIGKGGFGKVWRVKHIPTNKIYALKEMSKAIIIAKRSVDSILNQRNLLSMLNHRFLVNMVYAFQDRTTLYLLMEIQEGGDLRYHLAKKHKFTQVETRFIVATIILSLEYLHKKMVIHRDVKPENIVFDDKGYAHLTDLGIAKFLREENYTDTSGTPGYMAPQVLFHHNHRFQVDFFALGVIVYEIMLGKRPYIGKNRQEIKQLILSKQVLVSKKEIPENWTIQSADFINKLLQRRPVKRLGWAGIQQLKNHKWLRYLPWAQLKNKQIQSPFKAKYNPHEVRYRVTEYETQFKKILNKNKQMLAKGNLQDDFQGYSYGQDDATGDKHHHNANKFRGSHSKSKQFIMGGSQVRANNTNHRTTISSHGRYFNHVKK